MAVGGGDLRPSPAARPGGLAPQYRIAEGPGGHGGRVRVERQRRRRYDIGDAMVVLLRQADVKVRAEGISDLLGEERPEGLASNAPHDLTHEVALGQCVVTRRRAWLPPRGLFRQE